MSNFIVIRSYEPSDQYQCQEILKEAVMSTVNTAFFNGLTREITYQFIILLSAVLFIFFGLPVVFCLVALPIVSVLIYIIVWSGHYVRALEVCQELCNTHRMYMVDIKTHFWVAEVLEPVLPHPAPTVDRYVPLRYPQTHFMGLEDGSYRKRVVGTVAVSRSDSGGEGLARLKRLAVRPQYQGKGIASHLMEEALRFCKEKKYIAVELRTTECHETARQIYTKRGFELKNMFHKEVFGHLVTILQYDLEYNLDKWPMDTVP